MTLIAEFLQGVGDAVLNLHSRVTLQGAVLAIVQDCHHSTAVVFLVHNHRGPSLVRRNNGNVVVIFEAPKGLLLRVGEVGARRFGFSQSSTH